MEKALLEPLQQHWQERVCLARKLYTCRRNIKGKNKRARAYRRDYCYHCPVSPAHDRRKVAYIYALVDPRDNQICYIGKTDDPKGRLSVHIYGGVVAAGHQYHAG